MANLKTKAINSTDMAEIREGAYRHKHGTFKSTGEIPQKTERSYEPENGLNERGVEIILIVTLLVATLYSVYCVMLKRLKSRSKDTHLNNAIKNRRRNKENKR